MRQRLLILTYPEHGHGPVAAVAVVAPVVLVVLAAAAAAAAALAAAAASILWFSKLMLPLA
jgi:hypothetical protein